MAGADFIVSQGYVPETITVCAAHCVLPILGCSSPAEISQLAMQMRQLYQFQVSDSELETLGLSRLEAEVQIVKFFVATHRLDEFDGIAQTYMGKGIRFMIAGGVGVDDKSLLTAPVDQPALWKCETVAGWSTRKLVIAVTSSAMMKGDIRLNICHVLDCIALGRANLKA